MTSAARAGSRTDRRSRDTLTTSKRQSGGLQGSRVKLAPVDYLILAIYFGFVLGIGWRLRKSVGASGDFLTSGRSVPVWITSLALLTANLRAQEVIGMLPEVPVDSRAASSSRTVKMMVSISNSDLIRENC